MIGKLADVLRVKCRRCGHFRSPKDFIAGHAVGYCLHCYEKHREALDVLSGAIPKACVDCGVTPLALSEAQPGSDIRMSVVAKDGMYAVLCPLCADRYVNAHSQMFRGTPYQAQRN